MKQEKPKNGIPDKFYFRIGEVSEIAELPPYVLRFWESEFKRIKPKRTSSGQRLYRKRDVELILDIKHLLYDKKFTIKGARQHLLKKKSSRQKNASTGVIDEVMVELKSIKRLLTKSFS